MKYTVLEGDHKGHTVVSDMFAQFVGVSSPHGNKELKLYCLDCHEPVSGELVEEAETDDEQ